MKTPRQRTFFINTPLLHYSVTPLIDHSVQPMLL